MELIKLLLWVGDVRKAAVFGKRPGVPVSSTFERGEEETKAGVEEKGSGEAKRGTSAVIQEPNVRQNQIEGTGNDDHECGDFLTTKLKLNAELLEDEGASAVKKRKISFVDYEGRPQEQVSIEKTKHPETITNKGSINN